MKLIEITEDRYVVVDNSEIKEGDWLLDTTDNTIWNCHKDMSNSLFPECKKITHSTQPIESIVTENSFKSYEFIPLKEVKELIGEVDVEKRIYDTDFRGDVNSYKNGYNQAIEDNKEKKYTKEDILMLLQKIARKYFQEGREYKGNMAIAGDPLHGLRSELKEFIQPKTEWEVEIVDGKLKLK